MPVPLTTACLAFAGVLLPISEIASAVIGGIGLANQVVLEIINAVESGRDGSR